MITILSLYYLIITVLFVFFYYNERISPVTIFIFSQAIFFAGLIKYLDYSLKEDINIALIYLFGIMFFGAGAFFGEIVHPIKKKNVVFIEEDFTARQIRIIRELILISILLFLFFCYKTNFLTLKVMFGNAFFRLSEDVTNARLASYTVPGTNVIYAFRIALLPTITVSIVKSKKYSTICKAILSAFMILFTVITGQRGGFVYVMIMWLLTYLIPLFYLKNVSLMKKNKRKIIIIMFLSISVFLFLSTVNGRVHGSLFGAISKRFLGDNQITAYYAFHYIFSKGACFGKNYLEEIENLFYPGDKYLPLSKVINEILTGNTRGTSPPCLWGSVYYNFSWLGIVIFGFLFGWFAHYIGYRLYSREINHIRLSIYSYMFVDIGMLVAGGPLQLFNNGFIPLVILSYILHSDRVVDKTINRNGYQHQMEGCIE